MFAREESHEERANVSIITSRLERYRQQIRRRNLNMRFKLFRDSMLEQDELHLFKTILLQLAQEFSDCRLKELLLKMQRHEQNESFLVDICELRLDVMLFELLQKQGAKMSLPLATQLMTTLGYLTYFSFVTTTLMSQNIEFVDHLRERIAQLDMHSLDSVLHLRAIIVFLLNTTSLVIYEYNKYILFESGLSKVINIQLSKTVEISIQNSDEYTQAIFETRQYCLRFYSNIISFNDNQIQVLTRLMGQVLKDEENMLRHQELSFDLLSEAMKNEGLWSSLMAEKDSKNFCVVICEVIHGTQQRCFKDEFLLNKHNQLTRDEVHRFYSVILFLNQLFLESNKHEICWSFLIQTELNGYMLGQFLIQAHQRRDIDHVIKALRTFVCLARTNQVTGEQLIIVRPADDPLELLKIFTDMDLLVGLTTGPACLQVLGALLRKDPNFLPVLINFRVPELLAKLWKTKSDCLEIVMKGIELCTQLLVSERKINEERKVFTLMEDNGILGAIDAFCYSKVFQVKVLTEQFLKALSEYLK